MSTTHDWARQLIRDAEYLLSRKEVECGNLPMTQLSIYGRKEEFIQIVRATIPGKKKIDEWHVSFKPIGTTLDIYINRDAVCRKVQDVKYECEPLLSAEEEAEMEKTTHD